MVFTGPLADELARYDNTGKLATYAKSAERFARESKAKATRHAYESQWRFFERWCTSAGLRALPADPATLAVYAAFRAEQGASRSTIAQALAAIDHAHRAAGTASPRRSPEVEEVWAGIRRVLAGTQRAASALRPEHLKRMSLACGEGLSGARDRALILFGFAGAMRRAELIALKVDDVEHNENGLVVHIMRSKTDQEGVGATIGIPFGSDKDTCPVRALSRWLSLSGLEAGALFRRVLRSGRLGGPLENGRAVARILQRAGRRAGVKLPRLSGHSLRAGLVTTSSLAGKPMHSIMAQTRHKSVQTVYRYVRRIGADVFDDNAASGIGL
jgi:integrase